MDASHALLVGYIAGMLDREGFEAEMILDGHGDHTNQIRVTRPTGAYLITITPERP